MAVGLPAEADGTSIGLWTHIFGERRGVLGLFSGTRLQPGSKKLHEPCSAYFEWP